jgi:hypothetical protein
MLERRNNGGIMMYGLTNWDCGGRVASPIYLDAAWQMPNSEL